MLKKKKKRTPGSQENAQHTGMSSDTSQLEELNIIMTPFCR